MGGKSAINETHPLALGAGSMMTTLPASQWLEQCDLMLCLGSSLTRTFYAQRVRPGKTLIQNTHNVDEINKDESIDIGLVGDTKLTILALLDAIKAEIGEQGVDPEVVRGLLAGAGLVAQEAPYMYASTR